MNLQYWFSSCYCWIHRPVNEVYLLTLLEIMCILSFDSFTDLSPSLCEKFGRLSNIHICFMPPVLQKTRISHHTVVFNTRSYTDLSSWVLLVLLFKAVEVKSLPSVIPMSLCSCPLWGLTVPMVSLMVRPWGFTCGTSSQHNLKPFHTVLLLYNIMFGTSLRRKHLT